ncbi:MAG: bifunctional demethylmenaquinone methyltransferase/2-methoxy-6-polyprenyl-1,4-benzoquinol methylase UbiE [Gammaproteobacteria bacterium]|nr:bifunctional demethylmenaquinone methyltransferase/2-methoxy-6-polyprenyl-1,4-benzoquinol methylase UbiE [Gammaproteobacteria bacterium]
MDNSQNNYTSFGFQQVKQEDKQGLVANVFHDVANKYDIMNDLMSFGLHRVWKWLACYLTDLNEHKENIILDLAGGTGDITSLLAKKYNKSKIILSDINNAMLSNGRNKLIDNNIVNNIEFVQANAESLPFEDNSINLVTMAFGLRNVTNKLKALQEIYRVLQPGGKLFVLEFSKPQSSFVDKIYDLYSFNVLPKVGEWVTGKKEHYQYLVESIRMHPDQETLKQMTLEAGFASCEYNNFHTGVVALHRAIK